MNFGNGYRLKKNNLGRFIGFLNAFSGGLVGWSLAKLDKNYEGFAIMARRSGDNAEIGIGFDKGDLNIEVLEEFADGNDVFVTIIYDQIGSNDFEQTDAALQGQIVSNGNVILKNGKPCIIRSANNDGGYLSAYAPNDGVAVKGMFYVGDNEGKQSGLGGSDTGKQDQFFMCSENSSSNVDNNLIPTLTNLNGVTKSFGTREEVFDQTNLQFLLYREIEFNFDNNVLGLGYRRIIPLDFGMMTFQELVIFENTNDAVAKENNINSRYNIY